MNTPEQDPRLPRIREELSWLSDRMSTQARVIGIGALAVTWAVLTGDTDSFHPNRTYLAWLSAGAILLLFLDFIQYLAAYWQQRFRLKAVQRGQEISKQAQALFWIRETSFHLKIVLMGVTSILLIVTIFATVQAAGEPHARKGENTPSIPR